MPLEVPQSPTADQWTAAARCFFGAAFFATFALDTAFFATFAGGFFGAEVFLERALAAAGFFLATRVEALAARVVGFFFFALFFAMPTMIREHRAKSMLSRVEM